MTALDVVGTAEIAEMTGVKQNTLQVWLLRGHLPEPDASLSCGSIWRRKRVEKWIDGAGAARIQRARAA